MKFIDLNSDLNKIIKSFRQENDVLVVEYFDGEVVRYSYDEEKIEEIRCQMMIQAIERDERMSDNVIDRTGRTMILYFEFILALGLQNGISTDSNVMKTLCGLMLSILLLLNVNDIKTQLELKKYRLFFMLYERLDEINKKEILDSIRVGKNVKQLQIETLDDFTYGEIKMLSRKLDNEKN